MPPEFPGGLSSAGDQRVQDLERTVRRLEAERVRLLALLRLTPDAARLPDSSQTAIFDRAPGQVDASSASAVKVAFFRALFGARTDVYAVRWEHTRTHKSGWMPAVAGGFRKGVRPQDRASLPLTAEVVEAHLRGEFHLGLYPLLDGDRCCWLAADFDGSAAMLDALAYLKAARAAGSPAALEISRSGLGAHVWVFFTDPVPAATARILGTAFVHEAIALRGRMHLRSYDRLFPSQDALSAGGIGNLIAAPLQGRSRRDGATVFLDLATMEPHDDQFAYLSTLERLSPGEVAKMAGKTKAARVGMSVEHLQAPTSTRTRTQPAAVVKVRLHAGITLDMEALTPALLGTLKHAASMANPEFYERQRRRASVWNIPRFICSYDETLEGELVLPRGLLATVQRLVQQSGSDLELVDERAAGKAVEFASSVVLRAGNKLQWMPSPRMTWGSWSDLLAWARPSSAVP